MNALSRLFWLGGMLAFVTARGQGFVNLDFESAENLVPLRDPVTNALPGWLAFDETEQLTSVDYNNPAVLPSVELVGSNSLVPQGNFAVLLAPGVSISQTAMVPSGASSLLFDAIPHGPQTAFTVSLGAQNLSYTEISTTDNLSGQSYIIYGADISSFAGQEGTLSFSTPLGDDGGILDDIQFSTMIVPEPPAISLILLSSGILIYARYRFQKKSYRRSAGG